AEHIHSVGAQLEFFGFSDFHFFRDVHVETDISRALYPFQSQRAQLPGLWIDEKNTTLRIGKTIMSSNFFISSSIVIPQCGGNYPFSLYDVPEDLRKAKICFQFAR